MKRNIHNIVHYVTGQYMRQNKKRTLATFLGIVFTVLLMTCVFVGRESAIAYLEEVASQKNGKWHYALYDTTPEIQEEVEALPYVTETAPSLSLGLTDFPASANDERPYLNVKAYDTQTMDWNNIRLTEGRRPEHSGELLLSEAVREDGSGIQIGDTLDAAYFEQTITGIQAKEEMVTYFPAFSIQLHHGETLPLPQTFPYFPENDTFRVDKVWTGTNGHYTVVGFMEEPSFESKTAAGYTALTLADDTLLSQSATRNLFLQVDLNTLPSDAWETFDALAGDDNVETNDYLMAFSAKSSDQTMNLMVNLMTAFFLLLILAVSMVLIYNVFNISFQERSRYLGMLSSVGATARQKRSSVYYEARTLLLAALPVGILAGFGVVLGGLRLIQPYVVRLVYVTIPMEAPRPHLVISWQALACVIAASVVTVLVSAFLPARKIGRTGPIANIQGQDTGRRAAVRTYIRDSAERTLAYGFLHRQRRGQRSLFLATAAFLLVLVVASFGVSRVIGIIEYKAGGASNITTPFQERECRLIYNRSDAEATAFYNALKEEVKAAPQVDQVQEWYVDMFVLDVDVDFFSEEYWDAYLDIAETYLGNEQTRDQLRENYVEQRYNSVGLVVPDDETLRTIAQRCGADPELLFQGSGVILLNNVQLDSDSVRFEMKEPKQYRFYDIEEPSSVQPGESFTVGIYNPALDQDFTLPLTMAAWADNDQTSPYFTVRGEQLWLLMSRDTAGRMAQAAGYEELSDFVEEILRIYLAPGEEDYVDYLRQAVGEPEQMYLSAWNDPGYAVTIVESLCGILRVLLIAFVGLSSVVCLLNLWNAIQGRMAERRRDFAVLRSVGATRQQLERMLVLECLGVLGYSILLAGIGAGVLIYGIHTLLSDIFGHIVFQLPWGMLVFALVFTAGAMLGITLWSFRREKPQNLIEAIRRDSV